MLNIIKALFSGPAVRGEEKCGPRGTLRLTATDANGNPKPIFQENKFFMWMLERGIVRPTFPKIPVLLGRWQMYKEIQI